MKLEAEKMDLMHKYYPSVKLTVQRKLAKNYS